MCLIGCGRHGSDEKIHPIHSTGYILYRLLRPVKNSTLAESFPLAKTLFFLDVDPILPDLGCISPLNQGNGFRRRENRRREWKGDGCCRVIGLAQGERDFTRFEIASNIGRLPCGGNSYRKHIDEAHFDWIDAVDLFPPNSEWTPERVKAVYSLIVNRKEK